MGNVLVKEETLTQIADAIREKSGSSDSYRPGEMPDAILEISTYSGEGADPNKPVRFYDPYGELVYSYTTNEISQLEELPPLPEIKGLIGQEWNWSLEKILEIGGEIEIGSNYITDDGATRIYVELIDGALNPKIGFKQNVANSVKIDWGDGSEWETSDVFGGSAVSIEHQYAEPGSYVICLIPDDGVTFELYGYSYSSVILHKELASSYSNLVYANAIKKVELGKGITVLGDNAFTCASITSITIPAEVTDYNRAFAANKGIEYLVITKAVSSLTTSAFDDCLALKRVTFSETLLYVSQYAFYDCGQLEQMVLTTRTRIGSGYTFSNNRSLKRVVIKDCSSIGDSEFSSCATLREINIMGTALWEIGGNAFRNCESLEQIDIPDCVIRIGSYCFGYCYSLRNLTIPEGVTIVRISLCYNAYSLQEIHIPEGVTSIENYAFYGCAGIENYYLYPSTPPTLANKMAITVSANTKIHVPKGSLEAYQTADVWSELMDYMVEMEE